MYRKPSKTLDFSKISEKFRFLPTWWCCSLYCRIFLTILSGRILVNTLKTSFLDRTNSFTQNWRTNKLGPSLTKPTETIQTVVFYSCWILLGFASFCLVLFGFVRPGSSLLVAQFWINLFVRPRKLVFRVLIRILPDRIVRKILQC